MPYKEIRQQCKNLILRNTIMRFTPSCLVYVYVEVKRGNSSAIFVDYAEMLVYDFKSLSFMEEYHGGQRRVCVECV